MNWETGEGHPFEYFVFGAACSEVEIDCLTGNHKVSSTRECPLNCTGKMLRIPHTLPTGRKLGVWSQYHALALRVISLYC